MLSPVSPARSPLETKLDEIRKKGEVPLAVICYNVEKETFHGYVFSDMTMTEVSAVLAKLTLKIISNEGKM